MRKIILVSCVAAFFAPSLAFAGGADDKAAAQALFDEAKTLMDKGKYAEACPKLESSQKLDPGAGTLYNLAACYDKNGQSASAWVTYTDTATAAADRHPDWAKAAHDRAAELAPTLAHVTIVAPALTGLEVRRDGQPIGSGSFGTPVPIDPGHHTIDANAPGHTAFHQEIDVAPHGNMHVTVTLGEGTGPQQASESRGGGMRIAGLTVAGVGAVGIILGAVFGGLAIGKKNDAAPNCTSDFARCNAAGKETVDSALSLANVSTVAFIAGGVFAAAGLTIFFLAPKSSSKEQQTAWTLRTGSAGGPLGLTFGGAF